MWGKIWFKCTGYDYMAYIDQMELTIYSSRRVVKIYHPLIHFTKTLFTGILFIKSSRKTLLIFLNHPILATRYVRRPCVTCGPVIFHFVTFRIIMEIWNFCCEISLKNHWKFSRLVCGNPGLRTKCTKSCAYLMLYTFLFPLIFSSSSAYHNAAAGSEWSYKGPTSGRWMPIPGQTWCQVWVLSGK